MKTSNLKRKWPLIVVTALLIISIWITARGILNVVTIFLNYQTRVIPPVPLMGQAINPHLIELVITTALLITTWLLSTKVKTYQKIVWRLVFFFLMFFGIAFQYLWNITAPIYTSLVPYLEMRAAEANFNNDVLQNILVGDTNNLMLLILSLPAIVFFLVILWLGRLITKHQEEILEWFKEYEFSSAKLQLFFKAQETEQWPDIALGPEKKSKEMVFQKGRDRTLNNIIIGPIGTGKTSSLILPMINQDLHHMTRMINEFPEVYSLDNYDTEDVKGMYVNGLSIIEPSNDLCQKAFQLVKAHGIPEEAIFYIDPTNPNTKSINPLKGPVDKVAEAVTMVIEGVGENTEFFFEQSQRNHLKYYIFLLKLHDVEFEPTFSDLIRMYNNAQVVRNMHVKLKETIPKNWKEFENRDERNHWEIVVSVDEWFNMNLLKAKEKVTHGEFYGEDKYYDAKAEFVVGLRNILDDISSNILMRRVLFDQSDFDFDKHLEFGGVLLLNTAKGEMGNLSNVLGKFVLLSIQNAVLRRKPIDSAFHHLIVDEFPDYIYAPFKEFPAQSRKYKTIITVASQTLSQLAAKYGDHYMQTLLGTLRHKMVFGDLTPFDADLFSKQLGEDDRYEEGQTEQILSPLQDNPSTRVGHTYSKVREARMSPDDLIFQRAFECAVKLVEDNEPKKVRQLTSNFVDREEFNEAIVSVDEASALYWLDQRNAYLSDSSGLLDTKPEIIGEVEGERVQAPVTVEQEEDRTYEEVKQIEVDDRPVGLNSLQMPKEPTLNRIRSRQVEESLDEEVLVQVSSSPTHTPFPEDPLVESSKASNQFEEEVAAAKEEDTPLKNRLEQEDDNSWDIGLDLPSTTTVETDQIASSEKPNIVAEEATKDVNNDSWDIGLGLESSEPSSSQEETKVEKVEAVETPTTKKKVEQSSLSEETEQFLNEIYKEVNSEDERNSI